MLSPAESTILGRTLLGCESFSLEVACRCVAFVDAWRGTISSDADKVIISGNPVKERVLTRFLVISDRALCDDGNSFASCRWLWKVFAAACTCEEKNVKKTVRHRFPIPPAQYWSEVFFDTEYNCGLSEALGNKSMEVLEQKGDVATSLKRVICCTPVVELPGPLRKLFGDSVTYTEKGQWDAKTGRWKFEMTTSTFGDKVKTTGVIWTEAHGAEMERICEVEFVVKIFGVGGMLEKFLCDSMLDNQKKAAAFTEDFIREKGLCKAS